MYQFRCSCPTLPASGGVHHPSLTPRDPVRAPNLPKIQPKLPHFTFIGKEGNSSLQNCIYRFHCSRPALSASWEDTSPICHPAGFHQSPKSTKNTTKVTTFYIVATFTGRKGNSPLQNCIYQFFCSRPTLSGGVTLPISCLARPHQSPKITTRVTIFYLVATFIGKEGNSPLQNYMYQLLCYRPTLSASLGDTSPICHPAGP